MGSVSSVYVSPNGGSISEVEHERRNEDGDNSVELYGEEAPRGNAVEIRLCHSFDGENKDAREGEMGFTIQYLAGENARLALANKELNRQLEMLSGEKDKAKTRDIEIYGESAEGRLQRLERTLEAERQEKWKAIEVSEKLRVDLVNCEREVSIREEDMKRIGKELEESQATIAHLREDLKRLKSEDDDEDISERKARRQNELESFKAELMVKREMRQTALSAISTELHQLREELAREKALRRNLEKQLDGGGTPTVDADTLMALRFENEKLKTEVLTYDKELKSVNTILARLKNEFREEKRRHEKTSMEKKAIEAESEERANLMKEMEMEKERMWADYDREKMEVNKRTSALKDVVQISRQLLVIRESQVQELRKKLKEIEESVNNSKLPDQDGLRVEYEKQLQNIKTLKDLYEERVRLMEQERDKLNETITEHTKTIEGQKGEIASLKEQCGNASEELKKEKDQNDNLERDLRLSIAKSKDFENELSLINNLFTQMLLGPYNSGSETDLDKLTELLQENHDLITELTLREDSSEIASALPKLLLDLITQVEGTGQDQGREQDLSELDTVSEQSDSVAEGAVLPILSYKRAIVFEDPAEVEENEKVEKPVVEETPKPTENMSPAVQEIASNLPKVWRVLMELLSHHTVPDGPPPPGDENQCYKKIETPTGTRSVISVSNTFIRLKDLILEKKALQKELTRLKQLNSHLETRLDDQEKRLSQVQCELHKTWGIVGRMRAEHQQLHSHERILRYELQEKRVMLSELRQELEYCRDKWERARQKNDESETQWQKLRREFAARKNKGHLTPHLNDSGESGFSDEPNESGEEAENFDADRSSTGSPVERKPEASREASCDPENAEERRLAPEAEASRERERTEERSTPEASTSAEVAGSTENEARAIQREERLKRLEDQCQVLVKKVDITASKSNYLNNQLEELHEQYGRGKTETDEPTEDGACQASGGSADVGRAEPDSVAEDTRPKRTFEEMLKARSERLRRLEEQCTSLVGKMTSTVQRGTDLSNELEDIHVKYLNSEKAISERREAETAATSEDSTCSSRRRSQSEDAQAEDAAVGGGAATATAEPKEAEKTE